MKTQYCIKSEETNGSIFFKGDEVFVHTTDGGGRAGIISHMTFRGIYLHTGGKRDMYFRADEICKIDSHKWNME